VHVTPSSAASSSVVKPWLEQLASRTLRRSGNQFDREPSHAAHDRHRHRQTHQRERAQSTPAVSRRGSSYPGHEPILDYLELDDKKRQLVHEACEGAERVLLHRISKRVQGSEVWTARLEFPGGKESTAYVLKIGAVDRLQAEIDAAMSVVSVIEPRLDDMYLFHPDDSGDLALLRQKVLGGGDATSLRQWLSAPARTVVEAQQIITRLYRVRLRAWHFEDPRGPITRNAPLKVLLAGYIGESDWKGVIDEVGAAGLESVTAREGWTLAHLIADVSTLCEREEEALVGAVHGDLHAQNVLVSHDGTLELIDFAHASADRWRAIDFLMMECSIKYYVTPQNVDVDHLMSIEYLLDARPSLRPDALLAELGIKPYSRNLAIAAATGAAIRRLAVDTNAVADLGQYRRGLVLIMTALLTVPGGVNRAYLVRAIAYHMRRITQTQ
jgi:hypothetical protein